MDFKPIYKHQGCLTTVTVTSGPATVTVTWGAQLLPTALTWFWPTSGLSAEPVDSPEGIG